MSRSLLDSVLDARSVSIVFQPVFETIDHALTVHFVECLARGPRGTNMESAGVLFEYARRKGQEAALDLVCIEAAFREIGASGYRPTISVNVHASTLEREPRLPDFLAELAESHGVSLTDTILEIVEHGPDGIGRRFDRALAAVKRLGVRIALDDIGLGQSNYRRILDCEADYFKLDRYLIQGCHAGASRRALLDSLVLLARRMGARIVAEGVETPEEFLEVRSRGIDLVQGFLLAMPMAARGLGAIIDGERRELPSFRRQERSVPMTMIMHVNVYCASPECEYRGSVDAESYMAGGPARDCPNCGSTPLRIEIPGRPTPSRFQRRAAAGEEGATASVSRVSLNANA